MLGIHELRERWLLVLLSTVLSACCRNDILVTVENRSPHALTKVVAVAEPFTLALGDLAPQEKASGAFTPSQDTSLVLEYMTPSNEHRVQRLDTYFTHGLCGEVEVVLGADLKPSTTMEIEISPCWLEPLLEIFKD